jgi:RNA polymerase sigma factor (sigma-70 family)
MSDVTLDEDLVKAAQSGDAASLGALFIRHRASMQATALALLGPGPDAEDAVQDAALTALRRIDSLRDPSAARPWLVSVVRNTCLMRIRSTRPVIGTPVDEMPLPSAEPTPEQLLEQRATRDWVWHALSQLSEPLRTVALLRYFSDARTYEEIAALCGIPVGTVRSRLSQARTKLTTALTLTATAHHPDTAASQRTQWHEAAETLAAARRGSFGDVLEERWWPDVRTIGPRGERGVGREFLAMAMDADLSHGVRQSLTNVTAGDDIRIWESDLSVSDEAYCCARSVVWFQRLEHGRVRELRLLHRISDS